MLWLVSSSRWSTSLALLLLAWMAATSAASSVSGDLGRRLGEGARGAWCGPVLGRSISRLRSRLGGSLEPGGSSVCSSNRKQWLCCQVGGWLSSLNAACTLIVQTQSGMPPTCCSRVSGSGAMMSFTTCSSLLW